MPRKLYPHSCRALMLGVLTLLAFVVPSFAQSKILGGYFEEWSIYYAGYNIANLQQNGVANKLTHLIYAFSNVATSPAIGCSIADPWADYQTPYPPSVNGQQYRVRCIEICRHTAVKRAASRSKGIDLDGRRFVNEYAGISDRRQHGCGTAGIGGMCVDIFHQWKHCARHQRAGVI